MGPVPTRRHRAYRRRSFTFSTHVGYLRPSEAIVVLTCCEEVSNLTPRSAKRAHLVAKIGQTSAQEPPIRPPKTPKCGQNAVMLSVFTLRPFFQRSVPRPPKMLQIASQVASRWPSWPQLGASWRHLGSNLAPSWAIWARFSTIRARPKSAKIGQDSF